MLVAILVAASPAVLYCNFEFEYLCFDLTFPFFLFHFLTSIISPAKQGSGLPKRFLNIQSRQYQRARIKKLLYYKLHILFGMEEPS